MDNGDTMRSSINFILIHLFLFLIDDLELPRIPYDVFG
jgi:hypothetical protein